MDSKEAMRQACAGAGIKTVAEALGLSQTALYNQINDPSRQDILGRFVDFAAACEDELPIRWASEQLNGVFIPNPAVRVKNQGDASACVSASLREFSDVIRAISEAMKDGQVNRDEAESIRREWEDLKTVLESFVLACEFGYVK